MPDPGNKDVDRTVEVVVMDHTTMLTLPFPHSKPCPTSRTVMDCSTTRTCSGRNALVDLGVGDASVLAVVPVHSLASREGARKDRCILVMHAHLQGLTATFLTDQC